MNSQEFPINNKSISSPTTIQQNTIRDKEIISLKTNTFITHSEPSLSTINNNSFHHKSKKKILFFKCSPQHLGNTYAFYFDSHGNPFCIIGPNCKK